MSTIEIGEGAITTPVINRPDPLSALDYATIDALMAVLATLERLSTAAHA